MSCRLIVHCSISTLYAVLPLPALPQTAKQEVAETTKKEVAETAKQEVVEKRREKVDGTKQSPEQTFLKLLITEVIQSTFKA